MANTFPTTPKNFQQKVLTWFDSNGRKTLPWQQNKSPYRVWISEIMLQQTQVTTVIPYYLRFMDSFPTNNALAEATEDEVMHIWTGLGYYSRARNLHRTAKIIKQIGSFPNELNQLMDLPGIGRSTAGAILAIAFEKQAAILDGNVKRLLTRLAGIRKWPGEKTTLAYLWDLSEQLTPKKRVADFTQAMMDLGATVCTRGKPNCNQCPFEKICSARQQGIEQLLPLTKPKKSLPIRTATLLIIQYDHYVLLEKRPQGGVWQSLWSLLELPETLSLSDISQHCERLFSSSPKKMTVQNTFRHTFSHFHLDITPIHVSLPNKVTWKSGEHIWYDLSKPPRIGLPGPIKKLLHGISHVDGNALQLERVSSG